MSSEKKPVILIIDDSSTNLVLLDAILQEEGYIIETAFSAKEALKIVDQRIPDLILLDLLMPQVSGFDFLTKLKSNPTTNKIPVVVVSAVGTKENIENCYNLGVVDFINKPIDIPVFLKKVVDYLKLSVQ